MTFRKSFSLHVYKPVLVLAMALLFAATLQAQPRGKNNPSKLLLGTVVDQDDHPIPTAIVSLTNIKTKKIQQDISDDKGEFRFGSLDPDADYEVQVLYHNILGEKKKISMYDSRTKREFYWKLPLKLPDAQKEVQVVFWVSDEQGRSIPGAALKFTSSKRIETLTAATDAQGFISRWLSTTDNYSIVVEAKGYETQVKEVFSPTSEIGKMRIQLKAAK